MAPTTVKYLLLLPLRNETLLARITKVADGSRALSNRGSNWYWITAGAVVLFAGAASLRYAGAALHSVHHDEFYTFFAARSWARNGTLAIGQGEYLRASIYSVLTALSLKATGETMLAARMPAIVAGAITVPALFAFLYRDGSSKFPIAAWVAGILLCFSQFHIETSQLARFYALHALTVFGVAIALYTLIVERPSRNSATVWAVAGVAMLWLAMKLQQTTVIAAIGLATFAAGILMRDILYGSNKQQFRSRRVILLMACGVTLVMALLALMPVRNVLMEALREYQNAAPWAEKNRQEIFYYHDRFAHRFHWLWWLTPIAIVLAWRRSSLLALLGVSMFAVPLVLHSFAGMKAERYVLYIIPFWCMLWGLAVAEIAHLIVTAQRGPSLALERAGRLGIAVLFLGVAAISVPDYRNQGGALRRLYRTGFIETAYRRSGPSRDWTPYLPILRRATNVPVLVTSNDLRSLYYLGGYDLMLNHTVQKDFNGAEFDKDPRTGALTISLGQSVALVVRCYPKGAFLLGKYDWRGYGVTVDASNVIQTVAEQVPTPADAPFLIFKWGHHVEASPDCVALRRLVGEKPHTLPRLVHEPSA